MFGKFFGRQIMITLILGGFCVYIVKLFIQREIILYIHPRYGLFALIMCLVAVTILLAGVVAEIKKKHLAHHPSPHSSGRILNVLVVAIVGLAFLLPSQTLSSEAIRQRSLQTPTSNDSPSAPSTVPFAAKPTYDTCPEKSRLL